MPPPISRRLPGQCLLYRPSQRSFATTPTQRAGASNRPQMRGMRPAQRAAPSPVQTMKEQQKGAPGIRGLPTDMGMLPGTIIRPTGKNLPKLFSKERLDMEWIWLRTKILDKFGLFHWKFLLKGSKPRPKLANRSLVPLAKGYHKQIYTAFAAHDVPTITRLCCSGLTSNFRARLSNRAPSTHLTWSCTYAHARIVSNRASPLPGMENSGLRQVVVRLVSRQHLATWTDEEARKAVKGRLRDLRAAGKEPSPALLAVENEDAAKAVAAMRRGYNPISAHKIYKALAEDGVQDKVKKVESEAVEYLVLQRRMIEGVEEDWMVWGFAEESTEKVRKRDAKVMRDLEEYQKAQPAQV